MKAILVVNTVSSSHKCQVFAVETLGSDACGAGGQRISRTDSRVASYVIPTDEELVIARHTLAVIASGR